MTNHLKKLLLVCLLSLVGCGGLPIEQVPLREAPNVPQDAQPTPIGFNKIRFAVPTGTPTVSTSPRGPLGLLNCDWPYGMVQTGIRGRGFPSDEWREIFLETMEGIGYDITGSPGRLFDEDEDLQRTIYSVGGRIIDVKIDTCQQSNIWGIEQGRTGESNITVEWTVFDLLHRKNVLKTTTKGYGRLKYPNYEGVQLLFEEALASAVHNLGAQDDFINLVFYGEAPDKPPSTYEDPYEQPIGIYNPNETVKLPQQNLSSSPAKGRLEMIARAAVMIQTTGHGSGFFITTDGHIITNAHVVGNARRVRVVTAGKEDKLIAEVLRLDRKRDVALLKLETIPGDLQITTLPIRPEMPEIGEDVYAVGAPSYTRLQDTVTKGIVSAKRYDRRKKQWDIQADVETHGGNSGGPLIDENGNIIGLTVAGYIRGDTELSGLNLFIPIGDALDKLSISHHDPQATKSKQPVNLQKVKEQ